MVPGTVIFRCRSSIIDYMGDHRVGRPQRLCRTTCGAGESPVPALLVPSTGPPSALAVSQASLVRSPTTRSGENTGEEHNMRDQRLSMERDAVESMQGNLDRGTPAIVASYGVIGAIMLLLMAGFLSDRYLGTKPLCLLAGLAAGLLIGFYRLARILRG